MRRSQTHVGPCFTVRDRIMQLYQIPADFIHLVLIAKVLQSLTEAEVGQYKVEKPFERFSDTHCAKFRHLENHHRQHGSCACRSPRTDVTTWQNFLKLKKRLQRGKIKNTFKNETTNPNTNTGPYPNP